MNAIKRGYKLIGHYGFHIVFALSCLALILSVTSDASVLHGLAGQPIENTPLYRGVTIFVFAVMVIASGSGVVACCRRDARHRRMNEVGVKRRKAANNEIHGTQ